MSPWTISCHHGQYHVTMDNIMSPWTISCHHGQYHVTMDNIMSPWTISCHHGQYHVTMDNIMSPWTISCHHGQYHVTMDNIMSPWTISCHHGQYHVTMDNIMSPWIISHLVMYHIWAMCSENVPSAEHFPKSFFGIFVLSPIYNSLSATRCAIDHRTLRGNPRFLVVARPRKPTQLLIAKVEFGLIFAIHRGDEHENIHSNNVLAT